MGVFGCRFKRFVYIVGLVILLFCFFCRFVTSERNKCLEKIKIKTIQFLLFEIFEIGMDIHNFVSRSFRVSAIVAEEFKFIVIFCLFILFIIVILIVGSAIW